MRISRDYIKRIATYPQFKKAARAAMGGLPFIGASAVGIILYNACPEFKNSFDQVRDFLNQCPRGFEMLTSGITMGLIPDIMAQRFEGQRFNWRRTAEMSAVGAVAGGIIIRGIYDFLDWQFPGSGTWVTVKKVLFDRIVFTLPYMMLYLSAVHFIQGGLREGFEERLKIQLKDLFPKNCYFFIPCLLIIYSLPRDIRIYAFNLAAIAWYSYLSKRVHE